MGLNYRGFGLAWLAACLLAGPAGAATLTLGEMNLAMPSGWQRAEAAEEDDLDSMILRTGKGRLEVYLPRQRSRPKTDAAKFYEQLELSWQRRYGKQMALDWLEAGGQRWRLCRRPSSTGAGQVFQVVTLHGGEAYQLVVLTDDSTDRLPEDVHAMLASVAWGAGQPAPLLAVTPTAAEPPAVAGTLAAAQPTAVEPAAIQPTAVPAGRRWRLLRSVVALPTGKAWTRLARAEEGLLGPGGKVRGLGINAMTGGLDAYLEGAWQGQAANAAPQSFHRRWRVRWPDLPQTWQSGGELAFDLALLSEASGAAPDGGLSVRIDLTPACAPRLQVVRWLDGLAAGGVAGLPKLADMACATAPEGGPAAVTVSGQAQGVSGELHRPVRLAVPATWEQGIRAGKEGEVRRLVLRARFLVSEEGKSAGDAMLREAAAVFVYGPED
ncbi:MAG: hypothetical protein PHS77_02930 [Gallionellaceae bacterium]|nr:hypothetical protein [Gallionellaceae bacterium]